METNTPQPVLLLLDNDLIFPSRVREAIKPLGYTLRVAATEDALQKLLAQEPAPQAILVNLTARRFDPLQVITALKADDRTRALPVLAFAGHVEREKHGAARDAGADLVAANSSVALHLPALLDRLLNPEISENSENPCDHALETSETS